MTEMKLVFLFALMLGHATAVVELSCSDNATCIDHMAREVVRNLRERRSVKLFHSLTIEPLERRQGRSNEGPLSRFLKNHAFSYDWGDLTFRVSTPEARSDVIDFELFEGRSAKDISDTNPKKSASKLVEDKEEDKTPKIGLKRRHKKKVLMAVVPLLFGMKSTAAALFVMALVTVLTLKAFVASKLALGVTVGMALKKLYESYSNGVGFNHPYLYSQYPIDFPSASSNAYSVSGVSPQFGSPEMYNPTALGSHPHSHELLQQSDPSAQQSQQAPTLLLNTTRAAERWDGKSKLLKYLEPIIGSIRSFVDPIANVFYSMPATFRGLNADVSTTKSYESEVTEETVKKQILVPQPRYIAQRKMMLRKNIRTRPKKYAELKINLDRLKHNKDLYEYIKTKKYKYNYPNTYFYPRVQYFVNPSTFVKRNSSRLIPYKIHNLSPNISTDNEILGVVSNEWKPIVIIANQPILTANATDMKKVSPVKLNKNSYIKLRNRPKRSIGTDIIYGVSSRNLAFDNPRSAYNPSRAKGFVDVFESLLESDFVASFAQKVTDYAKSTLKESASDVDPPPKYFSVIYKMLYWSFQMIDELFSMEEVVTDYMGYKSANVTTTKKKNIKKKNKSKGNRKYDVNYSKTTNDHSSSLLSLFGWW